MKTLLTLLVLAFLVPVGSLTVQAQDTFHATTTGAGAAEIDPPPSCH